MRQLAGISGAAAVLVRPPCIVSWMLFRVGDRVKVRQDPQFPPSPFPGEPLGRVETYPGMATPYREFVTPTGTHLMYWIVFETPQVDADGDGPYTSAEVNFKFLERVAS